MPTPAATAGVISKNLDKNSGKGAAVRAGLKLASGHLIMIQDADLEYDPEDYGPMLDTLLSQKADAVYGSRYMRLPDGTRGGLLDGKAPGQSWAAYLGGRGLSLVALMTTRRYISDTVTALKLFRRDMIKELPLETGGFELDHEITSRIIARGGRIVETPIRYFPRSREEGKKIGIRDWFIALKTFWKYRNG